MTTPSTGSTATLSALDVSNPAMVILRLANADKAFYHPLDTRTGLLAQAYESIGDQIEALSSLHPFGGFGKVQDVAQPAVFLASSDAQWVTGVALPVDGGYTAQ